jgi:hypothetical protein
MEYSISEGRDAISLSVNVQDMIKRGWEPQGGVCFVPDKFEIYGLSGDVRGRFYQAMVKRKVL